MINPASLTQLTLIKNTLENLDLSANDLMFIPKHLIEMANLRNLNLSNNSLSNDKSQNVENCMTVLARLPKLKLL